MTKKAVTIMLNPKSKEKGQKRAKQEKRSLSGHIEKLIDDDHDTHTKK